MPFFDKDDFRGVASSRVRRPYKLFEACLDETLGERVRADGACAARGAAGTAHRPTVCPRSTRPVEWRAFRAVPGESYRRGCDIIRFPRAQWAGHRSTTSNDPQTGRLR